MQAATVYDEMVDFIASISPQKVIAFKPSATTQQRLEDLLYKEKNANLSIDEKSELDYYLMLEHLMRLAKARAYKLL